MSTQAMTPALAVLEWHRKLAEDDRKWMGDDDKLSDAEWDALHDGQVSRAKQAFARPVQSWEDVALLGALCIYWNFPHHDSDDQANMRELLGRPGRIGMDEQTLAHLLKAICTMGGFAPGEIPTTARRIYRLASCSRSWRRFNISTRRLKTTTAPEGPTLPTTS